MERRYYVDGKVITAYPIKAYKGRRGIAPHILISALGAGEW